MTLSADVGVRLGPLDLRVALDAADGETVAVLGPNGAGKTTLQVSCRSTTAPCGSTTW